MNQRLKTAMIGFGQIASGYAVDSAMARYYRYATHAQVLADHPAFEWLGVVDPAATAREHASSLWQVPHVVENIADLGGIAHEIEVAVLATPPESRVGVLDQFPSLRAVLVEKPLGRTLSESAAFLEHCRQRGVLVQVNLWRRADEGFRRLAGGELAQLIGSTQCAFGMYGNGLLNNGTHMIDFVRMLLGEVVLVSVVAPETAFAAGPIAGDTNVTCTLQLEHGVVVTLNPLRFEHYRENGIEVWGEQGRLAIYNEGLTIAHFARADNRAMTGERELAADEPRYIESTVGNALCHIFTNLADALGTGASLWSPGSSALRTAAVVESIRRSADAERAVRVDEVAATPVSAFTA